MENTSPAEHNWTWDEELQAEHLCLLVRWELLKTGYTDAKGIVDQWWVYDWKKKFHGIPVHFLFHPDADMQTGVLLMIYLLHLADLADTGYGEPKPERDREFLALLERFTPADESVQRLAQSVKRIIGIYQQRPYCDHFTGTRSAEQQATSRQLLEEQRWMLQVYVIDYFRKRVKSLELFQEVTDT